MIFLETMVRKNDSTLWEDFRKGEKSALSRIYHLYADQLFSYGKKFTTDEGLVKDTIQDLFFDLIRTRTSLGNTDHIYFYLVTAFRRRLFRSLNNNDYEYTGDVSERIATNIVYSIEDELIKKEQLSKREKIIKDALAGLSPKQREILYYRFTCDFDYGQICQIMSMKYDSARKMVFRALQSLRENIADNSILLFLIHNQQISSHEQKKILF